MPGYETWIIPGGGHLRQIKTGRVFLSRETKMTPETKNEAEPEMEAENAKIYHIPLFLDLRSRPVLILGGGEVAERKARLFSMYAPVTVISKAFTPGLKDLAGRGQIMLLIADLRKGFEGYLNGSFLIIPATDDSLLNRSIEEAASHMGILVNSVERPGDVVVPSIVHAGQVAIGISTGSPALTRYLRLQMEREIAAYAPLAELLADLRVRLKRGIASQKRRREILWAVVSDSEIRNILKVDDNLAGDTGNIYEKAYKRAREHLTPDERDCLDACDP